MLHFREPKYPHWGFDSPNPNLIKVVIDLRPSQMNWQRSAQSPLANVSNTSGQLSFPASSTHKEGERFLNFPPLIKKEDQRPGSSSSQGPPFGGNSYESYFGGPIFDKSSSEWRGTFYTRNNGEVIGAVQNQVPLPFNTGAIVRATGVMANGATSQSGFWVGPRLFLSTLHFHTWIGMFASFNECEQFRQAGVVFPVATEISRKVLNEYSPRVQLIAFDIGNDVGLFRLQNHFPDQENFIDISWLLEWDDARKNQLQQGSSAACCGFSAAVGEDESKQIQDQAAHYLSNVPLDAGPVINLDHVTKPDSKSFAPGTIDHAEVQTNAVRFGISASIWKGSSGGPCFLLDGPMAGAIIGTVRGADLYSVPYNSVNGFPTGMKDTIRAHL